MKRSDIWHSGIGRAILTIMTATLLVSCSNEIFEGEGDCSIKYQVAFRYTRNILDADAFASQVNSVSLFVFDRKGTLVASKSESGTALSAEGYVMELEDIQPGTYDLIAWCGMADGKSFVWQGGSSPRTKEDLITIMNRQRNTSEEAYSDVSLASLFHGTENSVAFPDAPGVHTVSTLSLTKNTNTIRIILQHYAGKTLDKKDFSFTIEDENGLMNYDNSVLADEKITYKEWSKFSGEVSMPGEDAEDAEIKSVSSVIGEIDVARLIKGHNAILTVSAADKEAPVLRLPLLDVLLLAKGEARRPMDDQEYLDRQDEYNLIFFLNDENGWYRNAGIYVNAWHVIYQQPSL